MEVLQHEQQPLSEHSFASVADSEITVVPQRTLPKPPTTPSFLIRLTKSLSPHEWVLGLAALVACYLVNGAFAPTVCALCTSIPAVVHSYRVITEEQGNLAAHQVTLCYWMLLGSMTFFDFLLGNAFCYYFGKFILMSSVYAHVVSKSRSSKPDAAEVSTTGNTVTEQLFAAQEITAPTQEHSLLTPPRSSIILDSTALTSPAPLTSKNSSLANYLQWTKKKDASTATPSLIPTTETKATQLETASPTQFSVHESEHFVSKPVQPLPSGDAPAPYSATFSDGSTSFGEVPLPPDSPVSDFNEASLFQTTSSDRQSYLRQRHVNPQGSNPATTIANTEWSRTLTPLQSPDRFAHRHSPQHMLSLSSMKNSSIDTIPCYENDLASNPNHTMTFTSPFDKCTSLTITNVTGHRMMWALKSNALDRVIATPVCGFLSGGQAIPIKMTIGENCNVRPVDALHDRLAIDYVFVPDTCVAFDAALFSGRNPDVRRKSFNVNYVF